jgi:hypothetical protein
VSIGGDGVGGEAQLFQVADAARLSDGRVVVANDGSSELLFFDPAGGFQRTVGAEGRGPGEFRGLMWLQRMAGDTIAVWDRGNQRLSAFTPHGDLVFETRIEPIPDTERLPEPVGLVDPGVIVVTARQPPPIRELRESLAFWLYNRDGTPQRQLAESRGVRNFETTWGPRSARVVDHLPFGQWPGYTIDPTRLYVSTGDAREIRIISASSETRTIWRHIEPLPELTDSIVEEFESTVMEGAPDDPDGRIAWRQWFDHVPYPERAAVYGRLIVGQDGTLWAADLTMPTFGSERWWLFDRNGQLFGSVDVPERFHPFDAGDGWVLGKWTDEMDVEYVRLYGIVRTTG